MTHEQETSLAITAYHADLAARSEPVAILWEQLDTREQQRYRAIATAVIAAQVGGTMQDTVERLAQAEIERLQKGEKGE